MLSCANVLYSSWLEDGGTRLEMLPHKTKQKYKKADVTKSGKHLTVSS